jgi:hypothetical protein
MLNGKVALTEDIPALCGSTFQSPTYVEPSRAETVPGLDEIIDEQRLECPNGEGCALIPYTRVILDQKATQAGAFCANACSQRLEQVGVLINFTYRV